MSLWNVVIDDAYAGLADIEAHQVAPHHQRSIISSACPLDDIVNAWLGVVLVAQQHEVRVDGQFRAGLRKYSTCVHRRGAHDPQRHSPNPRFAPALHDRGDELLETRCSEHVIPAGKVSLLSTFWC